MNKRAGFDFQTYLIGLFLIVGIIITFAAMYMDSAEKYNIDTTEAQNFSDTYNKISELTTSTHELQSKSENATLGTESAATTFYGSMLSLMKLVASIYSIPTAIINGIANTISIPPVWITIATMILVILVITTTLFMIFQGRGN